MKDKGTDYRPAPISAKEREMVDSLMGMMGGELSADSALSVLRRYNGDADKAASALLEGDTGGESGSTIVPGLSVSGTFGSSTSLTSTIGPRTPPPSKPEQIPPIIDLTADDEDGQLSRALQASLEDVTKFGPSTRAPDPNWAVVPSNVEVNTGMSQDDQSLSRAIEASLAHSYDNDVFEELPLEERVRKGGRPVALRPTLPALTYAGVVLHSLFFVPQFREEIAEWDLSCEPDEVEIEPPSGGPNLIVWTMMEIFANMDLAQMSELNADECLDALAPNHWDSPAQNPGDITYQFYNKLTWTIEMVLHGDAATGTLQSPWPRTFHFRHGFANAEPNMGPFDRRFDMAAVKVDVWGTEDQNDLISCLSRELGNGTSSIEDSKQQAIFEASEIVAFQLARMYTSTKGKTERAIFQYPKQVYLDQFLQENIQLANSKREEQQQLYAEADKLTERRRTLTNFDNKDTLADLRSSLYYYENIADDDDDPVRKVEIHENGIKLRKILTRIENELQTIDMTVASLRAKAATLFDCVELRKHRYDLRAVLVHDGLYGRTHLYSYVYYHNTWWKTLDYAVTEVSEQMVLNDPTGLHLGAGPYFLIYSRAVPDNYVEPRLTWPEGITDSVKHNNKLFLSQLPREVAAQVLNPNSPPSSPFISRSPSEYTISSGTVEPPTPMDTSD